MLLKISYKYGTNGNKKLVIAAKKVGLFHLPFVMIHFIVNVM